MLSPRLAELHRDAFIIDDAPRSTVDLTAHRRDSSLGDLDVVIEDATASEPPRNWRPSEGDPLLSERVAVVATAS